MSSPRNQEAALGVVFDWSRLPGVIRHRIGKRQALRTSVNCWPAELVQFNCFGEASRQLKLIGDWRITELPVICTVLPATI